MTMFGSLLFLRVQLRVLQYIQTTRYGPNDEEYNVCSNQAEKKHMVQGLYTTSRLYQVLTMEFANILTTHLQVYLMALV
jgi:hypothetical protein